MGSENHSVVPINWQNKSVQISRRGKAQLEQPIDSLGHDALIRSTSSQLSSALLTEAWRPL